jgi:hypothetical protein
MIYGGDAVGDRRGQIELADRLARRLLARGRAAGRREEIGREREEAGECGPSGARDSRG